jgi:hypothetical protein
MGWRDGLMDSDVTWWKLDVDAIGIVYSMLWSRGSFIYAVCACTLAHLWDTNHNGLSAEVKSTARALLCF